MPRPLSLLDWLRESDPEREAQPSDYTSRATVGAYLEDVFARLRGALPARVSLHPHASTVVDVEPAGSSRPAPPYTVVSEGDRLAGVQELLLCPGHAPAEEEDTAARLRAWAEASPGAHWVGRTFPVEAWCEGVPEGAVVGTLGMGLTFIDVALTLTEGRGGVFHHEDDVGTLRYEPSGREPARLVPLSRSGLLPFPKPIGPWPDREGFAPRFLTHDEIQRRRALRPDGRLDFERDLRPLVELEIERAYRDVAAAGDPEFSFERLVDPRQPADFTDARTHHRAIVRILEGSIRDALRGREDSPAQAAAEVWSQLLPWTVAAVSAGGLTAHSHRRFDEELGRPLGRITFGPPLPQAQRLLALARAGLVDFGCAPEGEATPDETTGGYRISSSRTGGATEEVSWMIDARIPPPDVSRSASPLLSRLYRRGWIRPFENVGPGNERYHAGGIDIVAGAARVRDGEGCPVPGVSAMGYVLGGWTFTTDSLLRDVNDLTPGWASHVAERARSGVSGR